MNKLPSFESIISAQKAGIYESNYLKANSPDGRRGLWIKHNLLRSHTGDELGEFWVILYERGKPPIVAKREVPWSSLLVSPDTLRISTPSISLTPTHAKGRVADIHWSLALSAGQAPLHHLPYRWMYTASFPKKKMLTPAPNLHFHGTIRFADNTWDIQDWVGLRGHNWGTEHAHTYAYGNCNLWDDGRPRVLDGFSARIKLGSTLSPWLSSVVARNPLVQQNRLRHWLSSARVSPTEWDVSLRRRLVKPYAHLTMRADLESYAGLRYTHPDGSESYCYNTKFADVAWGVRDAVHTSKLGELEVLFPEPLVGVPLHPARGWAQADGDYRS